MWTDLLKIHYKKMAFSFFAVGILFLGFYENKWSATRNFDSFAISSECLIIGRLAESQKNGLFSSAGLSGWYLNFPSREARISGQYDIYLGKSKGEMFRTYKSQIGFHGICFGFIDLITNFPNEINLKLFKAITALLSAVVFTAILIWFVTQFGYLIGFSTLLFLASSALITSFARNLWWQLWVYYVPVITSILLLSLKEKTTYSNALAFLAIFLAVFIKCLFSGYQYITTTLIMMVVPYCYYAIERRWNMKTFLLRTSIISIASIASILVSLLILAFQISLVQGSYRSGIDYIIYSFLKRTHGNPDSFPQIYAKSLNASIVEVLEKYFNGVAIDLKYMFHNNSLLEINFYEMILMFTIATVLFFLFKNRINSIKINRIKIEALVAATWISILAPLSWFTIFKAHAYIHPHIDNITWFMPFVLFGFALSSIIFYSLLLEIIQYCKSHLIKISIRKKWLHKEPISFEGP